MFNISKKDFIIKLRENKYFLDSLCLILAIVTLLSWKFNWQVGLIFLIIVAIGLIIMFDDILYTAPVVIYGLVINSSSFNATKTPTMLIVIGLVAFVLLFLYSVIKRLKVKFNGNALGLGLIALFTLIPVFWCIELNEFTSSLKILYFSGILYFLVYVFFKNSKGNLMEIVITTLTYLPLILLGQLCFKLAAYPDWINNISKLWFDLGWGICNEASILICMSFPFIVYRIYSSKEKVWFSLMLFISVLGLIFTFSRGGYLFGALELLALAIFLGIYEKKRYVFWGTFTLITAVLAYFTIRYDLISKVFSSGFDDSSRFMLFEEAFNLFKLNFRNIVFGSGFVSRIDGANRLVVYHSTFFEALALGGSAMIISLLVHCWLKYIPLFKKKGVFMIIMLIGFISVDLYGMIDNTYFMYYYMIPLVIILAAMDNNLDNYIEVKE